MGRDRDRDRRDLDRDGDVDDVSSSSRQEHKKREHLHSRSSKSKRRRDDVDDDEQEGRRRRRNHHRHDKRNKEDEDDSRSHTRRKSRNRHEDDDKVKDRERHARKRKDSGSSDDSYQDERRRKKSSSSKRKKHHEDQRSKKKSKKEKISRRHRHSEDRDKKDQKTKSKSKKLATSKFKKSDKSLLVPMGQTLGKPPERLLDPEKDYFTFHQQFWVYLFREEGAAFNDLTSEEAHEIFATRFAKQYNAGDLEAPYYDTEHGLPPKVVQESKTTQHTWGFQTTETERRGLQALQQGVRRQTEYREENPASASASASAKDNTDKSATTNRPTAAGRPTVEDNDSRFRRKTPEERNEERRGNQRLRTHVRNAQEELTGGPKDFRERQLEKRKEQGARMHGAHKDREEAAAGGIELTDSALYGDDGGGQNSLQATLARERHYKAKRDTQKQSRIEELQKKERERQENMLKMLGLEGMKGQKITIAPRKDA